VKDNAGQRLGIALVLVGMCVGAFVIVAYLLYGCTVLSSEVRFQPDHDAVNVQGQCHVHAPGEFCALDQCIPVAIEFEASGSGLDACWETNPGPLSRIECIEPPDSGPGLAPTGEQ